MDPVLIRINGLSREMARESYRVLPQAAIEGVRMQAAAEENGFRVRFGAVGCLKLVNMAESSSSAGNDGPRQGEVDDRVLIERFARGDATAFDRIVLRHQDRVARLAWRLMGFSREVDDIVQDVFLAALTNLKKFRGQATLGTWLATITIRQCRNRQRRAAVRRRFLGSLWTRGRASEAGPVDETVMAAETFEQGPGAIQALPPQLREVVVLRYMEGMNSQQVAEVLGLRRNAVDVRLHRAREKMRAVLGPALWDTDDERPET